jgi:hypothetical protein
MLQHGLLMELAGRCHQAPKDDSLGLLPTGDCVVGLPLVLGAVSCIGRTWLLRTDEFSTLHRRRDDTGVIVRAGEVRENLHIPVREVVFG